MGGNRSLNSHRRWIATLLAPALLVATPGVAQVYGYPIDPTDQRSTSNGSQSGTLAGTGRRSTGNTAASDAATTQSRTQSSSETSYQPDRIDQSSNTDRRSDRSESNNETDHQQDRVSVARPFRPAAPPSEFESYVSKLVDKPLRRFGANLLVPESRDFTAPPTTTVPPDYRLNPGDEILLGLTGSVEASNMRLTIDSDGRVFIPRVGPVNVAGVRYGSLQALIAKQVSRQYRNFRVAVSVGRLHGITVYVTGFAHVPGSYTMSSLSTLVNAVLAAGGPSAGGSFRSIQVRRNGQLVSDFDLYDLLLKGDKSADVVMQNDDVLFIAPAGAQVAVVGSVNVEAIYEARAGETLETMLLYAGGVNTVADDTRLMLLDPTKGTGWQQLVPAQVQAQIASRAEIVRVLPAVGIAQPQGRQPSLVTISGEVARPGRYYVQPGTPLSAVLQQAGGLTPQAFVYGTVFTRDSVRQTQRESYKRALSDIELLLTAQPLTSASQTAPYDPARLQAVRSIVDQFERREPDGRIVLNVLPAESRLPGDVLVENNDGIYVPAQPVTVGVFGAVPSPASFQYVRGETIGSYLGRAGNVQKLGDRSAIFVVRANGTLLAKGSTRGSVMKAPALPGDLIFVPVNSTRGEFWARLRDITSVLLPAVVTASAVTR